MDLLRADEFRRYLERPELLRAELNDNRARRQVVIDEVQKVPALLDEVHWLHENAGIRFALCGSSAGKVKRGQANLLGGRAIRYELHGLTAFENWVFQELCAHNAYRESFARLSYWRLASGIEVDFIVDDMVLAIEAKSSRKITNDHLKGLRHLTQDHPSVRSRVLVCLESRPYRTDDGIWVLPASEFCARLAAGELF